MHTVERATGRYAFGTLVLLWVVLAIVVLLQAIT
jgi:hypothetical protein